MQPFGGLYTTHMRNEGDRLLEAVEESLRIGSESGVHLHISHHKSAGRPNWGKVKDSLERVDAAIAGGQRVTLDVYPYTAGSGRMIEYFNLDKIDRTLAEVIRIASCPAFRELEGRMLVDVAAERGVDVTELVREVLTAPLGDRTICIHFIIDEADVETNLAASRHDGGLGRHSRSARPAASAFVRHLSRACWDTTSRTRHARRSKKPCGG